METTSERLHSAVEKMLAPYGRSDLRSRSTLLTPDPFDTSKPNQHDSKAEFQRELAAVEGALQSIKDMMQSLGLGAEDDDDRRAMLQRLIPVINQKLRQNSSDVDIEESVGLVRNNVAQIGGFTPTILILLDFQIAFVARLQELMNQEEKFWNLSHRAPDYYARIIALRLAKVFAVETGERPTYGTSADGGLPSTNYARALEEVFEILAISQTVRTHAQWAVQQITDEDINPAPVNGLSAMLMGKAPRSSTDNISEITRILMKKGDG